ncbi:MAG TPA: hypothetical protein VM617_05895, partial [Thermoanaerobaculia bacterium]|nr:hypothetical protein [Thermoanaerobaculia bacterium]
GMTGSEAALPIWRAIAERGLEEGWLAEDADFGAPPGVTVQVVEHRTGLLPGEATSPVIQEAFVQGTEPLQQSTAQNALVQSLPWYQQRAFYLPKEGENMTSEPEAEPTEDGAEAPPPG